MSDSWTHGDALRVFREETLGISQAAAAQAVGVSLGAYGAWERGSVVPKRESLHDIVQRLKVPPEVVGYEAPKGYELVPVAWMREQQAVVNAKLDQILELLDP